MKVIDFHCDTILRLMEDKERLGLRKNHFSVDLEKLREGNVLAQFFALFVDLKTTVDPLETALEMADKFHQELWENQEQIGLARNYDEILKNERNGRISAFLTIEEGGVIKGKLYNLRNLYRLGVRLMTLTWNYPNEIGYPNCKDEYKTLGLTSFGAEIVHEMNKIGMIIDVSHLSDGGFYDVARLSQAPFVASHSNARAIKEHRRNLTDHMIKTIGDRGGIIGINFEKSFLGDHHRSNVDDMIDHIRHMKNKGGIDVISIGSDFDGIGPNLEISHMGEIQKLVRGLEKSGFSDEEMEKICFKNALRVIKEVLK